MSPLESLQITPQMIDEYLAVLEREGKTKDTIRGTRNILRAWYESLPDEKHLTADAIEVWESRGREMALANRTIKNRVTVVKTFLRYLENADDFRSRRKKKETPSLTRVPSREEYYLILQAAKEMGSRRTYLLIKTIVCLGIRTTELSHLCVEGLTKETVWIPSRNTTRSVKVFEPIRTELLEYAAEHGIKDGPVFITKEGQPMQHFLIWKELKKVHLRTGLPECVGLPKNLYLLYTNTRKECAKESAEEVDKNYLALLQEEETIVGWNNNGSELLADLLPAELKNDDRLVKKSRKKDSVPKQELTQEQADALARNLGKSLSEILSRKYDCKITITFTRKEDA